MNKSALKKSIRFQVILYGSVGITFFVIHIGYGMQLLAFIAGALSLLCAVMLALTLYNYYNRES